MVSPIALIIYWYIFFCTSVFENTKHLIRSLFVIRLSDQNLKCGAKKKYLRFDILHPYTLANAFQFDKMFVYNFHGLCCFFSPLLLLFVQFAAENDRLSHLKRVTHEHSFLSDDDIHMKKKPPYVHLYFR